MTPLNICILPVFHSLPAILIIIISLLRSSALSVQAQSPSNAGLIGGLATSLVNTKNIPHIFTVCS